MIKREREREKDLLRIFKVGVLLYHYHDELFIKMEVPVHGFLTVR